MTNTNQWLKTVKTRKQKRDVHFKILARGLGSQGSCKFIQPVDSSFHFPLTATETVTTALPVSANRLGMLL